MAQKHSAQDLQTKKTRSLPDDLKKIADELIAEKFAVKEEVVERKQAPDPFRQEYAYRFDMGFAGSETVTIRQRDVFIDPSMDSATRVEPGVERRVDFYSRRIIYSTPIVRADTRAFRDAVYRLDRENAPRNDRKAIIGGGMARELSSHPDFRQFAMFDERNRGSREKYLATMFGVPIFVVEGAMSEIQVSH